MRVSKILLTVIVLLSSVSGSVWAQHSLTVDAAIAIAVANNRELAAARVAIREAEARLQQASLWPNPEVEVNGRFDNAFNNEGEHNFATGVSQPFSISGRISAQTGVARVNIERTGAEVADLERRIVGTVRRTFTELLALEEQISLQKFLVRLNNELLSATRAGLKQGQISEKDVNAIHIALQQAQQRQKVLETQKQSRLLELNKLLGRPADSIFITLGNLEFKPLHDLSIFTPAKAMERRPDFLVARLDVETAKADQRLAGAQRFEDWRIGADYEREKTVVNGAPPQDTSQFIGLKMVIPLPLFDRKQGRIRETLALEDRAQKTVEALKLQIGQELADALNRVKSLAPLLESYTAGILKQAEGNVKLVEDGYRKGLASIVEVIQSRQQFAELKSSYIDTVREYQLALIDLEIAAGLFPNAMHHNQPTGMKKP
jgi:cobalt-zinc-cadmium efflux system outer membrane protein